LLAESEDERPVVDGLAESLAVDPRVEVRIFGKPDSRPNRRMGVALATAADVAEARELAQKAAAALHVI
jgi:phosphoribosylglycinamide formyltransferase 2